MTQWFFCVLGTGAGAGAAAGHYVLPHDLDQPNLRLLSRGRRPSGEAVLLRLLDARGQVKVHQQLSVALARKIPWRLAGEGGFLPRGVGASGLLHAFGAPHRDLLVLVRSQWHGHNLS